MGPETPQLGQYIEGLLSLSNWTMIYIFVILVCVDVITGYVAARIKGDFTSRESMNGIFRQLARITVYLAIITLNILISDQVISGTLYLLAGCMIYSYVVSVYENFKKLNEGTNHEIDDNKE